MTAAVGLGADSIWMKSKSAFAAVGVVGMMIAFEN
jgi:hypothetical protein